MDRQVLYNTHGVLLLFTGIAVALLYRTVQTDRRDRSALWIAATTFACGSGLLILSGAHRLSMEVVGTCLFLATPTLLHIAIGSAARESIRSTLPWVLVLSLAGLALHAATGNVTVALLSVPVVELITMWLLLRHPHSVTRLANRAMAVFLALHIVSFCLRIHIIVARLPHNGYFAYAGMLTVVGLGVSFVGMEALRSRHEFERLAMTDALTGLLNRRGLELLAPRELMHCVRNGTACSALMLDIDRFKEINDTLGHAAGDASLCTIAGILQSVLRLGDIITRHGGDEFFVLLPDCDEENTVLVVARLRHAIDSSVLHSISGEPFRLNVSIGAATSTGTATTVQDLLHASDIVLYREKLQVRKAAPVPTLEERADGGAQVQPSNA